MGWPIVQSGFNSRQPPIQCVPEAPYGGGGGGEKQRYGREDQHALSFVVTYVRVLRTLPPLRPVSLRRGAQLNIGTNLQTDGSIQIAYSNVICVGRQRAMLYVWADRQQCNMYGPQDSNVISLGRQIAMLYVWADRQQCNMCGPTDSNVICMGRKIAML